MKAEPFLRLTIGLGFGLSCAATARAADAPVKANLSCETLPQIVLCSVRLEPFPRTTVKWAEASFAGTPGFVRAVRHKATYRYSPTKAPVMFLGLEPTGGGEGDVNVMVRSVACPLEGDGACSHQSQAVRTRISISPRR